MSNFTLATKVRSKLRLALTGVSGSGKTLGALLIASGLTGGDFSKVALIDTEHERARLYAGRGEYGIGQFLYAPLYPPYSPDRYIALAQEAAQMIGPDGVLIIDSLTHAWNNEGGVLDIKDLIASKAGMNSYTAWNQAGKEQNGLINSILSLPCHTIVTMRSKMDYVMQENDRGKMQPVKVGLAPVQREDTEYEFDIVLDLARNHIATASKDVTFLDKYGDVITPELGKQLKEWLDSGEEPAQPPQMITAVEWASIKEAAGNNAMIINAMMQHFGVVRASEIRMDMMPDIMAYCQECAAKQEVPYADTSQ